MSYKGYNLHNMRALSEIQADVQFVSNIERQVTATLGAISGSPTAATILRGVKKDLRWKLLCLVEEEDLVRQIENPTIYYDPKAGAPA